MNRLLGSILAITWLIAMGALVQRDVLPLWTAEEPPRQVLPAGEYQIGIFNQADSRIGTTWISTSPSPMMMVRSTTVLEVAKITGMLPVSGTWILGTDLMYDSDERLDQFRFTLNAPGVVGEVNAERIERDFSVIAKLGDLKKTLLLDGELSRYLSETLRPFTHLERLHVGQSWRIRLLDPFALMKSQSVEFQSQLAKVTRRETIHHRDREIDCFRVETPTAVAWADEFGRVLKQQVQLPLIGTWTLLDEAVDVEARVRALPEKRLGASARREKPSSKPGTTKIETSH